MIDGQNFFNKPVKSNLRTYDNFRKLWLVKEMITQLVVYWIIIIFISKQQAPDADPKAIKQTNFTRYLAQEGHANKTMFFIIEEVKETTVDFS